jgi:hypothetical protein
MMKKHEENDETHGHEVESKEEGIPYVARSETSKEAALSKKETRARDERRVMDFVKGRGEHGATDYEIEVGLKFARQSSVSARRGSLVKKGQLRDSGLKRKTCTGRYATVWIPGTGHAVRGSGNERVTRPSPARIRSALLSLDKIMKHSEEQHGPKPEVELHETLRWLSKLARQQEALSHGVVVKETEEKQ